MESAIPPHLRCPRTRQARASADYTPPVPAHCARMDTSVQQVVMAYFGVQYRTAAGRTAAREQLSALRRAALVPFGPRHGDLAVTVDESGFETLVWAAYWADPAAFQQWELAVADWWNSDDRLQGPCGWFREVALPRVECFETLFSSPERPEGMAKLAASMSGEIREHSYWGSMRDRLAASQTEPLVAAGSCSRPALGRRVRLSGSENLALIRSGQDWSDTQGEERRLYLQQIEPRLREGMDYLRDRGCEVGCLANRYLIQVDERLSPLEKSYGLSWWRGLEHMERWSESHPTHLEIFAAFMRMAQGLDFQLRLRLYHEVSVLRVEEQRFEYVNCHPATGLLRVLARG